MEFSTNWQRFPGNYLKSPNTNIKDAEKGEKILTFYFTIGWDSVFTMNIRYSKLWTYCLGTPNRSCLKRTKNTNDFAFAVFFFPAQDTNAVKRYTTLFTIRFYERFGTPKGILWSELLKWNIRVLNLISHFIGHVFYS